MMTNGDYEGQIFLSHHHLMVCKNIIIHRACEGGIEKSIPRMNNWHIKACGVMTNMDREGQIFLSHPHTKNGLFFLLTTYYPILYWKKKHIKRLLETPEFAEMRHVMSF